MWMDMSMSVITLIQTELFALQNKASNWHIIAQI